RRARAWQSSLGPPCAAGAHPTPRVRPCGMSAPGGPRMSQSLQITASQLDPALLDLPWERPLEEWPEDVLAALPRGISRHIVRFVRVSGRVLALKELNHDLARREYEKLRVQGRLVVTAVEQY